MEPFLAYLQQVDPLWGVVPVAVALGGLLVARLSSARFAGVLAGAMTLTGLGLFAAVGVHDFRQFSDLRRLDERHGFERRAESLFGRVADSESVMACIDGAAEGPARDACERRLFADPARVAAAVAIVTQRVVFLDDAMQFAARRDPEYATRVSAMRAQMEADPYGLVAFVFSVEHRCTPAVCPRFSLLRDPSRVRENMRVRRMEAHLAKYAAASPARSEGVVPAVAPPFASAIVPTKPDPANATVGPTGLTPSAATLAVEPPAAAVAPLIPPPAKSGFAAPPRPATPSADDTAERDAARAAARAKAKAKPVDPVSRPSAEPVAGLPRVVPSEYIREQEEKEAAAQNSSRSPAAPTPIAPPRQNFNAR